MHVGALEEADGFEDRERLRRVAQLHEEAHELALDVADRGAQCGESLGVAEDQRAERLAVDRAARGDDLLAEFGDDPAMRVGAGLIHRVDVAVGVELGRSPAVNEALAEQGLPRSDGAGDAEDDGHISACRGENSRVQEIRVVISNPAAWSAG